MSQEHSTDVRDLGAEPVLSVAGGTVTLRQLAARMRLVMLLDRGVDKARAGTALPFELIEDMIDQQLIEAECERLDLTPDAAETLLDAAGHFDWTEDPDRWTESPRWQEVAEVLGVDAGEYLSLVRSQLAAERLAGHLASGMASTGGSGDPGVDLLEEWVRDARKADKGCRFWDSERYGWLMKEVGPVYLALVGGKLG